MSQFLQLNNGPQVEAQTDAEADNDSESESEGEEETQAQTGAQAQPQVVEQGNGVMNINVGDPTGTDPLSQFGLA